MVLSPHVCQPLLHLGCTTARSKRSLADANRPDRRAVLDRERMKAVAEKQREALEAARAAEEKKSEQKMQVFPSLWLTIMCV